MTFFSLILCILLLVGEFTLPNSIDDLSKEKRIEYEQNGLCCFEYDQKGNSSYVFIDCPLLNFTSNVNDTSSHYPESCEEVGKDIICPLDEFDGIDSLCLLHYGGDEYFMLGFASLEFGKLIVLICFIFYQYRDFIRSRKSLTEYTILSD